MRKSHVQKDLPPRFFRVLFARKPAFFRLRIQKGGKEAQRKKETKEKKELNRCRFIIGEKVLDALPELWISGSNGNNIDLEKLDAIILYLRQCPDFLQLMRKDI